LILTPLAGFGLIWKVLFTDFSAHIVWMVLDICIVYALLYIPLTNWYIKKLYGQYLDKLIACLEELEEKNS